MSDNGSLFSQEERRLLIIHLESLSRRECYYEHYKQRRFLRRWDRIPPVPMDWKTMVGTITITPEVMRLAKLPRGYVAKLLKDDYDT